VIDIFALRDHVGVEGPEHDDALLAMERAGVAHASALTNRYFGPLEETTEVLAGTGTATMWLRDVPVGDVEVVQAYSVGDPGEAIDAAGDLGYVVRDGDKLVRKSGTWHPRYEYRVTYTRGYAAGTEPDVVKMFVLQYIAREWFNRKTGGLQSETMGGYTYTVSRDGGGPDVSLLAPFRRYVIA
jgi:hypothetical protein